jgi:dextranase
MMDTKKLVHKRMSLGLSLGLIFSLSSCGVKTELQYSTGFIESITTDKARYALGEAVHLEINTTEELQSINNGSLNIVITHLDKTIIEETLSIEASSTQLSYTWIPPLVDYSGYLISIYLIEDNKVIDQKNIAVDVSSSWDMFPRYGYLANFDNTLESDNAEIMSDLNRYHLSGLLFYDWQYRHEQPVSVTLGQANETWLNIANSKVYASKVISYITLLHERNMLASNYNLVYGAYEDFAKNHPEMALYKDSGQKTQDKHDLPDSWASDLYLVNPSNTSWQAHYLQMEKEAIEFFKFDIMHLDTLGNRGTLYDSLGKPINMEYALAKFTEFLKANLNQGLVFNFVNEYAKFETTKTKSVDFAYTEVWPDRYPTYSSLKGIIDKDRQYGLASVLAAYMNYTKKSGSFNTAAVLYTEAVILATGGAHLSLGDQGMLSSEYFPNNKLTMTQELKDKMIEYGDFMVAYQNLLRGGLVEDNVGLSLDQYKTNSLPVSKSIWLFSKENERYKTVHLINLLNRRDTLWRDDYNNILAPEVLTKLKLNVQVMEDKVSGVYVASPDINGGTLQSVAYTLKNHVLTLLVPELSYWSMVVIVK